MAIEKNREHSKDLYLCFIDYTKAFDMVIHELLWKDMQSMGFPEHIILLLKSMSSSSSVRSGLADVGDHGSPLFPVLGLSHKFNVGAFFIHCQFV